MRMEDDFEGKKRLVGDLFFVDDKILNLGFFGTTKTANEEGARRLAVPHPCIFLPPSLPPPRVEQ